MTFWFFLWIHGFLDWSSVFVMATYADGRSATRYGILLGLFLVALRIESSAHSEFYGRRPVRSICTIYHGSVWIWSWVSLSPCIFLSVSCVVDFHAADIFHFFLPGYFLPTRTFPPFHGFSSSASATG